MALFRSILNVTRWGGHRPNALKAGRVDAYAGVVAPGLMGMKSVQHGQFDYTHGADDVHAVTVSNVNINKAILLTTHTRNVTGGGATLVTGRLTAVNTITFTKRSGNNYTTVIWSLIEFY